MHLEIVAAGSCRPWGCRTAFPARRLVWHNAAGKRLAIDAGYGPTPAPAEMNRAERLYRRLFRVVPGEAMPDYDDLLLTHHHLDHAGGAVGRACVAPPLPPRRGAWGQLHRATFSRTARLTLRALPPLTQTCLGFPAVGWHDLEVLHLPGHTRDHHGVYFPALHLLYVCDAVWYLDWLRTGLAPGWARWLQEEKSAFDRTLQALAVLNRHDPNLRLRCAHDPAQPVHEHLPA